MSGTPHLGVHRTGGFCFTRRLGLAYNSLYSLSLLRSKPFISVLPHISADMLACFFYFWQLFSSWREASGSRLKSIWEMEDVTGCTSKSSSDQLTWEPHPVLGVWPKKSCLQEAWIGGGGGTGRHTQDRNLTGQQ